LPQLGGSSPLMLPLSQAARRSIIAIHAGHCGRITNGRGWKIVGGERMSTLKSRGTQYKDGPFRYSRIRISQALCTIQGHQDRCIGRVWPRLASGTCPGCYRAAAPTNQPKSTHGYPRKESCGQNFPAPWRALWSFSYSTGPAPTLLLPLLSLCKVIIDRVNRRLLHFRLQHLVSCHNA
jgi:hypothetical protein